MRSDTSMKRYFTPVSMKYQLAIAIAIVQSISGFVFLPAASMAESSQFRIIDRTNARIYRHNRIRLSQTEKIGTLVSFPEVGLTIEQPIGFIKATSFYGFEQSATNSSVMLTKIPGPFSKVTQGFDKSNLATRGISLISKQPVKIDNQQGILLQVTQSAYGEQFRKWVLVFGNEQSTQIVTATFLDTNSQKIGEPLKKVLLAISPRSSSAPNVYVSTLPFTVTAVAGLSLVNKVLEFGKVLAFTKDGNIPTTAPTDPLFIVAPSLGDILITEQKSFATRRLSSYPQIEISTIISNNKITIDNVSGWEIIANGRDRQTKASLTLYQVVLFKQGGYILMTGIVGDRQSQIYLPKFKSMALTFRSYR